MLTSEVMHSNVPLIFYFWFYKFNLFSISPLQWPSDAGTFYSSCSSSSSPNNPLGSDGLRQHRCTSGSGPGYGVGSVPLLQPVSSTCTTLSLRLISFPPCERWRSSSCPAPSTSRPPHTRSIPCQSCCSSIRGGHIAQEGHSAPDTHKWRSQRPAGCHPQRWAFRAKGSAAVCPYMLAKAKYPSWKYWENVLFCCLNGINTVWKFKAL